MLPPSPSPKRSRADTFKTHFYLAREKPKFFFTIMHRAKPDTSVNGKEELRTDLPLFACSIESNIHVSQRSALPRQRQAIMWDQGRFCSIVLKGCIRCTFAVSGGTDIFSITPTCSTTFLSMKTMLNIFNLLDILPPFLVETAWTTKHLAICKHVPFRQSASCAITTANPER